MWQEKSCLKEQISKELSMTKEGMQKRDMVERGKSTSWVFLWISGNMKKKKAFPNYYTPGCVIFSIIWFVLAIVLNHSLWENKSSLLEIKKKNLEIIKTKVESYYK